jgi:hypothetical protein
MAKIKGRSTNFIDDVQVTADCLTGRAGINLFARYLRGIDIEPHFLRLFGAIRKHTNGLATEEVFKQLMCFFFDGTSRHLTQFDVLAKDTGYAAVIETAPENMASSHAIKRFIKAMSWQRALRFRRLLLQLFLWRLRHESPEVIILGLDTMVMDNDDAPKREGVEPTYKKILGFAPLQMTWGRFIIDAVFRSGDTHSNHADHASKMIKHVVHMIRTHYSKTVPIIIRMDSGFSDQKLFAVVDTLGAGYICGGRFMNDIKALVKGIPESAYQHHFGKNEEDVWEFLEFGDRRASWNHFLRAIFWRPLLEEKQFLLPGSRPGTFVYTNLGMGGAVDKQLQASGLGDMAKAEVVIHTYHGRGEDELVHRSFKDFGFEELPFKRFAPNTAMYYVMVTAFFLFETFKQDVSSSVIPTTSFPTTLRRKLVDVAAKIVTHAGRVVLKVTADVMERLNFKELWQRSLAVPQFCWLQ